MAGDVATTGTTGAGVTPAHPAASDQDAAAGEDAVVAPDEAVPGAATRPAAPPPAVTPAAPTPEATATPAAAHAESTGASDTTGRAAATGGTTGGAAVRRRLARLGAPRGGGVNPVLEPLIKTVRATHPKADVRLIERAYGVAAQWHSGQKRKSGDPYITHPLAVATILAELGMNHETLCAALLHDTIEDTDYTLAQLRREFGDDVAALVNGVDQAGQGQVRGSRRGGDRPQDGGRDVP